MPVAHLGLVRFEERDIGRLLGAVVLVVKVLEEVPVLLPAVHLQQAGRERLCADHADKVAADQLAFQLQEDLIDCQRA